MDILKQITDLKEALDGSEYESAACFLETIHLNDGRTAHLRLILIIDDGDD